MEERKENQVIWVFGVLERLCNLGMIGGFGYHVNNVDQFIEIDEQRSTLFDNDEMMGKLVSIICHKECGITAPEEIGAVIHLVKCYKDKRSELVKFALEEVCSKS